VQTISPSDSSESSTTTRRSSADSLGGTASASVAGADPSSHSTVPRGQRKRAAAAAAAAAATAATATAAAASAPATAAGRFRGDPDGSPVPPQPRASAGGGRNGAGGSGGSTPRRRPYGHESPAASGGSGSLRRGADEKPSAENFDHENEEQIDELFIKHQNDQQQRPHHQHGGGNRTPLVSLHCLIYKHDGCNDRYEGQFFLLDSRSF
jgi:hypothetical protein